jgi:hypothetical protein
LLLGGCGVALDVPLALKEFVEPAFPGGIKDGPQARTEMRNAIVHPKKLKVDRKTYSIALSAVQIMGCWYLELTLLSILGVAGLSEFANERLTGGKGKIALIENA